MLPTPPHIQILTAIKQALVAYDWPTNTGVQQVTVRHARNRPAPSEDAPTVTIVWTGVDEEPNEQFLNDWEKQLSLDVEIVVDMVLPTEDSALDDIGWTAPSFVAAGAVHALLDPTTTLARMISPPPVIGGIDPDTESSSSDNARLVQTVTVLYRVQTTDPNILLWEGVNGA